MDNKKNEVFINKAQKLAEEISTIRKNIAGNYNNREMSLVITKLQEAEQWVGAYIQELKS